jgi:catechol 2,3-dioxygenase-like lactoylglutathione lyase family enzyme
MDARFAVLSLGVDDLERAYKFYHDGLGFPSKGIVGKEFENGEVAFFEMKNGVNLAVYSRKHLAWDANVPLTDRSSVEFSIGYNVRDTAEVDSVLKLAKRAGAKIVKPGQKAFWGGYHGYFQDPDGLLWEILWSPQLLPKD